MPALVDAASILTDMHRQLDLAERLLRDYLASPAKSEDAPAFKVHEQLGDLLEDARRLLRRAARVCGRGCPGIQLWTGTKSSTGDVRQKAIP